MRLINLGDVNKKLLNIIIGSIGKLIAEIILYAFSDDIKMNNHPFILGINSGLGMTLTFILLIILKCKTKNKDSNDENIIIQNTSFQENTTANTSKLKLKIIIITLCCILDYIQKLLSFLYSQYIITNLWIFDIVFLAAFSLCILHLKLYSHQYISSLVMIIFGIILNLITFEYNIELIYKILLSFFIECCFNMSIVLAKYGMNTLFLSPFEITFYEGLFALIINIITLCISTSVDYVDPPLFIKLAKSCKYKGKIYLDNFWAYLDVLSGIEILVFIVQMFSRTIFNLFSNIIANDFTPSHVIFILIVGEIFLLFKDGFEIREIADLFIILIEIFMLLIFTEIIELNFCKLQYNTKKNIREREKLLLEYDQKSDDSGDIGNDLLFSETLTGSRLSSMSELEG